MLESRKAKKQLKVYYKRKFRKDNKMRGSKGGLLMLLGGWSIY